jgi:hypothetical protein
MVYYRVMECWQIDMFLYQVSVQDAQSIVKILNMFFFDVNMQERSGGRLGCYKHFSTPCKLTELEVLSWKNSW